MKTRGEYVFTLNAQSLTDEKGRYSLENEVHS